MKSSSGKSATRHTPSGEAVPGTEAVPSERVFTIPNALSFLRLLGVGVFLWIILAKVGDGWALLLLVAAGVTDWLDGYLARRLGQMSRLGRVLDPTADRLYIIAVVVGLAVRHTIPWWLVGAVLVRDLVLLALVPALRTRGLTTLPVHYLGKAATFNLLYAFPLLLVGDLDGPVGVLARVFGWAFAIWGIGLYWWAGALYLWQAWRIVTTQPRVVRTHP